MGDTVQALYGNRTRIRVCGLCIVNQSILLVNHRIGPSQIFWAPPGGGLEFGEDCIQCLQREFLEETGISIEVGEMLFTTEFLKPPLHAVELFFEVKATGGKLTRGFDPEAGSNQLIESVQYVSDEDLAKWAPTDRHGIFDLCPKIEQLTSLKGYFKL